MLIKPQTQATFEKVVLRVPSDLWEDAVRYAQLLGGATTPQYIATEALRAAVTSPEYRRLVERAAEAKENARTIEPAAPPKHQRKGPHDAAATEAA